MLRTTAVQPQSLDRIDFKGKQDIHMTMEHIILRMQKRNQ